MYCTLCGNKIDAGENYCTSCGAVVLKEYVNEEKGQANFANNSKGNVSFVFGLLAFLFFWMPILSVIFAILGIVFGISYKKETGHKTVGVVFGGVGLILAIVTIIGIVLFSNYFVNWLSDEENFNSIIEEYGEYFDEDNSFDIGGNDWYGDDGSVLQLDVGGHYAWYQDSDASGDSYFLGDYVSYNGYEAMNYIADNLGEYGITREEQRSFFELGDYEIEDYYLLILNCDKVVIDGVEQEQGSGKIYYYGFYDDDKKRLDLVNMSTANEAGFTLKSDKVGRIDI